MPYSVQTCYEWGNVLPMGDRALLAVAHGVGHSGCAHLSTVAAEDAKVEPDAHERTAVPRQLVPQADK